MSSRWVAGVAYKIHYITSRREEDATNASSGVPSRQALSHFPIVSANAGSISSTTQWIVGFGWSIPTSHVLSAYLVPDGNRGVHTPNNVLH